MQPTRHTVQVTRIEHRLGLPAAPADVSTMLAIVGEELRGDGRQLDAAEVRAADGVLTVSYEAPRLLRGVAAVR
ncbi:hypothetical protein N0X72_25430 [Streptomyces carpaticus]|uniref:hypothetical protein n=1 Tax=Streptomyces TaxID=1883 RepID=UPI002206BAB7|nr:hypothetical protein N0X72_25430 [Streptomyces carpaticus]